MAGLRGRFVAPKSKPETPRVAVIRGFSLKRQPVIREMDVEIEYRFADIIILCQRRFLRLGLSRRRES